MIEEQLLWINIVLIIGIAIIIYQLERIKERCE